MKPTDTFRLLILTAVVLVTSLTVEAQNVVIRRNTTTTTTRTTKRTTTTTSRQTQPIKPPKKSTVYSETFTVGGVTFKMIRVEGKGSPFYIGETEVTQELWQAVMGSNPSNFKGSNLPVEDVSWHDCKDFLNKLNSMTGKNFRLPKEKEWEYAAKGGNRSRGYKYSGSNTVDDVAWYWKNSGDRYLSGTDDDWNGDKIENNNGRTHPIKTKKPNELGIYDMSGNVWEWCEDLYDSSGSNRVCRGGSWNGYTRFCRVSYRLDFTPAIGFNCLGLRLARSSYPLNTL